MEGLKLKQKLQYFGHLIQVMCKSLSPVWLLGPHGLYTVYGILQTRIVKWVAFLFSKGSSQPRDRTHVSYTEPPGKPKNTGVGSLSFLQRIFPTQELNLGFLHCRQILYQLSYEESWLIGKESDDGKDWGQEEKGTTEMRRLDGISDSMDTSLNKLWKIVKDRESLGAAVHGVAKNWTQLCDWTTKVGLGNKHEQGMFHKVHI